MAAPKKNAVLLIGPPMSKAIIAPRSAPSMTALPPLKDASHAPRNFIRSAIGGPMTLSIITPDHQRGHDGDDQDRHDRLEVFRRRRLLDEIDDVTREQPGEKRSQETRADGVRPVEVSREIAADEPGHEARPAGQRVGDVTRQHRQHEREGARTDLQDKLRAGGMGKIRSGGTDRDDGNRTRDEDAAARDKGNGEGNAVQEGLLDLEQFGTHGEEFAVQNRCLLVRHKPRLDAFVEKS